LTGSLAASNLYSFPQESRQRLVLSEFISKAIAFAKDNWGNLASVAGLFVAGLSAFFAKGAREAARESRLFVLQNTLAEEINLARTLAVEIAGLVDLGELALARLRCSDLHDRTLTVLNRWDGTLTTESKNNLLIAKSQLDALRSVILKLSATGAAPTARQLSQMQTGCGKIREVFIEEHASAMRRNDEADNA
jgi:hypothetical protein